MHKDFSDWYRPATAELTTDLLERRWTGVAALTKAATFDSIRELTRYFFGLGSPQGETLIRNAAKVDTTFPSEGAKMELRILAGIALRVLFDPKTPTKHADVSASAMLTASFGPRAAGSPYPQHVDAALNYLSARGNTLRTPEARKKPKLTAFDKLSGDWKTAIASNELAKIQDPLNNLILHLTELKASLADHEVQLSAVTEESDILWWLFGGAVVTTTGKHISGLPEAARSLAIATELAGSTTFCVPPASSEALISKAIEVSAGDPAREYSIVETIDAADREWRTSLVETAPDPALQPLMYAIHCSLQTGAPGEWTPIFRHNSLLDANQKFSSANLTTQFYRELLFDHFFVRTT